jgi:methylmalonyl-CoA mutase
MEELLAGIDPTACRVDFNWGAQSPLALALFLEAAKKRGIDLGKLQGGLHYDPLADAASTGSLPLSEGATWTQLAGLIRETGAVAPDYQLLMVSNHPWHNAGATIVQDLAFTLAAGVEHLARLGDAGVAPELVLPRLGFRFSVASNYFFEVARLRAARLLWATIVREFGVNDPKLAQTRIHASTSGWNKSVFDPNVNMLRVTTEAMSAVIGGVQSLSVLPFDSTFRTPDEFSYRIARNVQLVIREESGLDKVIDPAAGSYYLEKLTDEIAEAAWKLFQQVEEKGGLLAALKSGFVQQEIAGTRSAREKKIHGRVDTFLGTNSFPNLKEHMLERIGFEAIHGVKSASGGKLAPDSFLAALRQAFASGATVGQALALPADALKVAAVPFWRGPQAFEELRLATEKHVQNGGKQPVVFLWTQGSLAMRKARATFCLNFFGTAGYSVVDTNGFKAVEEGIAAAVAAKADVVVLFSSDEEYATLAEPVFAAVKAQLPNATRLIAGSPTEIIEALKAAGADDFVHMRTNAIQFLKQSHEKLGVKA